METRHSHWWKHRTFKVTISTPEWWRIRRSLKPRTLKDNYHKSLDGGLFKRLWLWITKKQCDWWGCELCRPDVWSYDYE